MFKKITLSMPTIASLFAVAACNSPYSGVQRAEVWQPHINMPSSVVVCRSKQCAPAKISMSKEYIYNSLMHLLDNNAQNKALICTADPSSHVCTENYITLPITVGVTPANMYIDDVKITDVSASLGNKSLNLVLNYNVTYNGQHPTCKPAETLVYVKNSSNIILEDAGYSCKMTTIGNTTIKTLFAIDYIDLDYGYIGGYYSVGLSGPAYGGGSGYMLLRLPKDAYPLAPILAGGNAAAPETAAKPAAKEPSTDKKPEAQAPVSKTQVPVTKTQTSTTTAQVPGKKWAPADTYQDPVTGEVVFEPVRDPMRINPKAVQPIDEPEKTEMFSGVKVFPIIKKKAPEVIEVEAQPKDENAKAENAKGGTLKDSMKKAEAAATDKTAAKAQTVKNDKPVNNTKPAKTNTTIKDATPAKADTGAKAEATTKADKK